MTDRQVKILCVVDYFLPGFLGGGPIRTIANLRRKLSGRVDISILTRDRDLGAEKKYESVKSDIWNASNDGKIFYASPEFFGWKALRQILATEDYDLIYLNSFFGFRSSIQMYLWTRGSKFTSPILLAPRGEFSPGALQKKWLKKRVFLTACKFLKLYKGVEWHASTNSERDDILLEFPHAANAIHVAEDPVNLEFVPKSENSHLPSPEGELRAVFISRISPMKNLFGLLQILGKTTNKIDLDIFGPVEDETYWRQCQNLISALPSNVTVSYRGAVNAEQVSSVFSNYDIFVLPTHGENFGHVIFESLLGGTPVLISDRTPWQPDATGAVSVVSTTDTAGWVEQLKTAGNRTSDQKMQLKVAARECAEEFARNSETEQNNLKMFRTVAGLVSERT